MLVGVLSLVAGHVDPAMPFCAAHRTVWTYELCLWASERLMLRQPPRQDCPATVPAECLPLRASLQHVKLAVQSAHGMPTEFAGLLLEFTQILVLRELVSQASVLACLPLFLRVLKAAHDLLVWAFLSVVKQVAPVPAPPAISVRALDLPKRAGHHVLVEEQ